MPNIMPALLQAQTSGGVWQPQEPLSSSSSFSSSAMLNDRETEDTEIQGHCVYSGGEGGLGGKPEAEEGMEDEAPNSEVNVSGRARRQKGWWKRGVVETKFNTVNMAAWVHKECDIMN